MYRLLFLLSTATFLSSPISTAPTYPVGRIKTPLGEILFYLYPETPHHRDSFIRLAGQHYWDSLTFNRVIKNFVAQGGCPDTPEGFKGSPYNLAPEFNDSLRHVYGAVGAVATTTRRNFRRAVSSISSPTRRDSNDWMATTRSMARSSKEWTWSKRSCPSPRIRPTRR